MLASSFLVSCSGDSSSSNTPADLTCSKPTTNAKTARSQIVGKWTWIQTETVGRAGAVISTPKTENKTQGLNFKDDGTVEILENDKVLITQQYDIVASASAELTLTYSNIAGVVSTFALSSCTQSIKLVSIGSLQVTTIYNK